jgi:3-deoxy-7-phosphoheptulonate synthase
VIIVLSPHCTPEQEEAVVKQVKALGLSIHISRGKERTLIGAIGDERVLLDSPISTFDGVEKVVPILKPYKIVSREFQENNTVLEIDGAKLGGSKIQVIAGPCSVENEKQLMEVAVAAKAAGCDFIRGGAYKPRSSPYSFQGLETEGLRLLRLAKRETGLRIVTEILDPRDIALFEDVDVIQVGARNSQNFRLLKELGRLGRPVLLKRGLSGTITELLMSAEYIAAEGNQDIILCERGIRTFETETRNTLDVSAAPVLHKLTHLPVILDPSHSGGRRDLVEPLALAAIAAGADGLLIEVHANPQAALCDGPQAITPNDLQNLMVKIRALAPIVGRVAAPSISSGIHGHALESSLTNR